MTNTSTHPNNCIGNVTTDTPRTDAASFSSLDPLELMKTSRQLERELNDLWSRFDKQMEAESRLAEAEELIKRGHDGWQKAESEVERLKAMPHFHHESYCRKCKEAR